VGQGRQGLCLVEHLCYTVSMAQAYRHKASSASLVNYHFVWCPKYRRSVLVGAPRERAESILRDVLSELGCELIAVEIMPDHVHLFANCPPTLSPWSIIHRLKGRSSRLLRSEFAQLRRLPSLWTRSYFVATAGNVSSDTVRRYIEAQRNQEGR
jgi:putative transposase